MDPRRHHRLTLGGFLRELAAAQSPVLHRYPGFAQLARGSAAASRLALVAGGHMVRDFEEITLPPPPIVQLPEYLAAYEGVAYDTMPKERLERAVERFRSMGTYAFARFRALAAGIFKEKTRGGPSPAPSDLGSWGKAELIHLLSAAYGQGGLPPGDHNSHHYPENQRALADAVRLLIKDNAEKTQQWREYLGSALASSRGHEPRRHRVAPLSGFLAYYGAATAGTGPLAAYRPDEAGGERTGGLPASERRDHIAMWMDCPAPTVHPGDHVQATGSHDRLRQGETRHRSLARPRGGVRPGRGGQVRSRLPHSPYRRGLGESLEAV